MVIRNISKEIKLPDQKMFSESVNVNVEKNMRMSVRDLYTFVWYTLTGNILVITHTATDMVRHILI